MNYAELTKELDGLNFIKRYRAKKPEDTRSSFEIAREVYGDPRAQELRRRDPDLDDLFGSFRRNTAPDIGTQVAESAKAGVDTLQASASSLAGTGLDIAGNQFGGDNILNRAGDSLQQTARENIQSAMRHRQKARAASFEDIGTGGFFDTIGDASSWALNAIAEETPGLALDTGAAIASGGLSLTASGARFATTKLIKDRVQKKLLKELGEDGLKDVAEDRLKELARGEVSKLGQLSGALASSYIQNAGEISLNLQDEEVSDANKLLALTVGGGVNSILDFGLPFAIARKVSNPTKNISEFKNAISKAFPAFKEANPRAAKILEGTGFVGGSLRLAADATKEGLQESVQELVSYTAAQSAIKDELSFELTDDVLNQMKAPRAKTSA